ncbi:hypothetical protein F5051DRAFT_446926 [Lentinula edodes]|nr:hypothetical protein F5051DRAFT_446926 [Lentinula edodes]
MGIPTGRAMKPMAQAKTKPITSIDEDRKGVPIAFFLFSAPTGNQATQAGYNTEILRELLNTWKIHLVNNTACLIHIPALQTQIPKNVGPSFRFGRKSFSLSVAFTSASAGRTIGRRYWLVVRETIGKIMCENVCRSSRYSSVEHAVARNHLSQVRVYFTELLTNPAAKVASKGRVLHLDYLDKYWMPVPMWQSWSECGRIAASTLLKVPVEGVILTTNHLESFNAILKRKYIRSWLHSGHRLHFDVLIILLVTRILPDLFACRLSGRNHRIWVSEHFKEAAGGLDLRVLQEKIQAERKDLENKARRVCWWEDDPKRQALGGTLVSSIGEHVFQGTDDSERFYTCQCPSSRNPAQDYTVTLHRLGRGSCNCFDFQEQGGACKHLWALRQCVDYYISTLRIETPFNYPVTLKAAQEISSATGTQPNPCICESSVPAIDWKAVQMFGQDCTSLGGNLDEGELEDEDEISLTVEETPESNTLGNTQTAIDIQKRHRLEHDVSRILPSLYGIENLLSDNSPLPINPVVKEFEQVLKNTLAKIAELHMQLIDRMDHPQTTISESKVANQISRKRKDRKDLRPPSPEAGQKRKTSHGTM